jgi:hypothetical protein
MEQSVDHTEYAVMPRRVVFLDLRHLGSEDRSRDIDENRHCSLLYEM